MYTCDKVKLSGSKRIHVFMLTRQFFDKLSSLVNDGNTPDEPAASSATDPRFEKNVVQAYRQARRMVIHFPVKTDDDYLPVRT